MDDGLMKKAMAFRVKYRINEGQYKRKLSLDLLGVHPMNRRGVYPNPDRIVSLGIGILKDNFNLEEANHAGVCVQEVPRDMQEFNPAVARDQKSEYESYDAFNKKHCTGTVLGKCWGGKTDTLYGTLSHSHLLLILLCIKQGARWELPAELQSMLDTEGCLNAAAVAARDASFIELAEHGLEMEILSWKIYIEEPDACSLISQALNKGQSMALRTTELTALAALTGIISRAIGPAQSREVEFEAVEATVREELDLFVDDPHFQGLFQFVLLQGADHAPFNRFMLLVGSYFVDSTHRRLALSAFADMNKLPVNVPWVKVAILIRAYRREPIKGWCPSPEPQWKNMSAPALGALQTMLSWWLGVVRPALGCKVEARPLVTIMSNVMLHAAAAALKDNLKGQKNLTTFKADLMEGTTGDWALLQKTCWGLGVHVPAQLQKDEDKWMDYTQFRSGTGSDDAGAKRPGMPKSEGRRLMPSVIKYDDEFKAVSGQDTRDVTKDDSAVAGKLIPWKEWIQGGSALTMDREASDMAAITTVMRVLHKQGPVKDAPLSVIATGDGKKLTVRVDQDVPKNGIVLYPCVPKSGSVLKTSVHPLRATIEVTQMTGPTDAVAASAQSKDPKKPATATYYVNPEFRLPKRAADAAAPDDTAEAGVELWTWTGDESLHPFWAVERLTEADLKRRQQTPTGAQLDFNLVTEIAEISVVTAGGWHDTSLAGTTAVKIPILTNPEKLTQGDVLICQVQANKTPPKRQTEDWRDDVAKKRKAEAKSKAGGAAASAKKSSGKHKAAADNIQDEV